MIPGYERRAVAWGAPGMVLHYVGYFFGHIPLRGAPALIVGIAGLLGTIALGIGFGLYARGKKRSWGWSFLALIGLLGLVILLLLPDKAASERDPESQVAPKPGQ